MLTIFKQCDSYVLIFITYMIYLYYTEISCGIYYPISYKLYLITITKYVVHIIYYGRSLNTEW